MIDRDLAELYSVQTKRINEQVKRNIQRFPPQFCFQLTKAEFSELVANCDRFVSLKHSSKCVGGIALQFNIKCKIAAE